MYREGGLEDFEYELDQALDLQTEAIVIEPVKLGVETARWISVGNFLHKTAVLSGLTCILTSAKFNRLSIILPFGVLSVTCAGIYLISWQTDPCCKYQVETDVTKIERLPLHKLSSSSPIILVRKDDQRRRILHNAIALTSLALCSYKVYKLYS